MKVFFDKKRGLCLQRKDAGNGKPPKENNATSAKIMGCLAIVEGILFFAGVVGLFKIFS